ncbi:MAG: ATP-grasp domain-containing protein [Gammaproteobacteria bacterium]|nr:ATP-grasp domain-containing protein [Gammaproteobacteria bacterium]
MFVTIRTLLIANRGEIACRVIATARRLGMHAAAVYSDADAGALHVRHADSAYRIGPAPAVESYLDIDAVLAAAQRAGADAIHPGYGFLSENADFADACTEAGIAFVGPSSAAIRAMGSKVEAKRLIAEAGTPVVPGYQDDDQDDAVLAAAARKVGFPLLIKASAGGGGKGMRLVEAPEEFAAALEGARREAAAAFADEKMLLERYLVNPKHLEVQILADTHGNTVGVFERDCSVQRRHQKVIEEAPGPTVGEPLRRRLLEAAVNAAQAIGYSGAGTVEFIAEGRGVDTAFYFMEMNTRLQVEHPVTEAITGLDLVEWQLRIAAGEPLEIEPEATGHAIEARLYAESPARGFLPSAGKLRRLRFPGNVRVDTGVEEGDSVPVHYDPMVAKLIAHGPSREAARRDLIEALENTEIAGIEHNAGYLRNLLAHPEFVAGDYGTHLADTIHGAVTPGLNDLHWALAALAAVPNGALPWSRADGWRVNQPARTEVLLQHEGVFQTVRFPPGKVVAGDSSFSVEALNSGADALAVRLNGRVQEAGLLRDGSAIHLMLDGETSVFQCVQDLTADQADRLDGADRIVSPMPGQVISLAVAVGEVVEAGDLLAVIEAMKMEHSIVAPCAGEVTAVHCSAGQRVDEHTRLLELEPRQ